MAAPNDRSNNDHKQEEMVELPVGRAYGQGRASVASPGGVEMSFSSLEGDLDPDPIELPSADPGNQAAYDTRVVGVAGGATREAGCEIRERPSLGAAMEEAHNASVRNRRTAMVCGAGFVLAVLVCVVFIALTHADEYPRAQLPLGALRGKAAGRSVDVFLGVPYAEPPARWARPEAKQPWRGERAATAHATPCVDGAGAGSEDCLYADVYVPSVPALRESKDATKAVLVWLHGGCYTAGGPEDQDAVALSQREGIIVVVPAFRLGAFGFLYDTGRGLSGWYGLWDQRMALQWVQHNIHAFGGDPARVTLAGDGAGAAAASIHYVAPRSRGLFRGAVMHSGGFAPWATMPAAAAEHQGAALFRQAGCTTVACLRALPAARIAAAAAVHASPCGGGCPWAPPVDGDELDDTPYNMVVKGHHSRAAAVLGTCADDGERAVAAAKGARSAAGFVRWLDERFPRGGGAPPRPENFTDHVEGMFPPKGNAAGGCSAYCLAAVAVDAAYGYFCPTALAARALSGRGVKVWHFVAAQDPRPKEWASGDRSCVLPYLWTYEDPDTLAATDWRRRAHTPVDNAVAREVQQKWGSFARVGQPGAGWPVLDVSRTDHRVLHIGSALKDTVSIGVRPYGKAGQKAQCEYYRQHPAYFQACFPQGLRLD
eukprot:TRINITY_DN1207_c1_g2_i1.p1 TRINITY_DN1207_c1_g2~~TRINITY_DN1207_c1_g2_i1.p1  ORF type:complete len:656 (+),score=168.75 TRINITY_DN1207_c1_g2_i1:112-2079(+)